MNKKYKEEVLVLFGRRVAELRLDKKLSLRELAKECDLDNSKINKIEKGKINVQFFTILELAGALKVHPKELFDFKHEWKEEAFM
ncbi:helix-turn-helix transcriptional regulator [Flavivirga abyssicola]|uniref:helix-turn-helix domain-containing protein n=1 Tax=Flavivirga abyssicola TaxID=3063533 RepID=UPI0026E0F478|nr:helix-turn-helix transcriptional regulator [Flavivirga sp. MEBiC07777]WVK14989.1 helix-turn-helix transcriptional regulator [Flavivirga sp. MEBiC07777]